MSTEPPPFGSGQSPDDDPFRKQQPPPQQGGGSPYDPPPQQPPYGSQPPPPGGGPYGGGPYGGDPYGGGPYPNDPLSGMPPLADSGKRVLARIIDMILVGIVVGLLAWAFRISQYTVDSDDFEFGKSFAQEALAAVLYIAYDTYFSVKNGQTLGKRLLKLRVANLNDGSTPSVQTALIRAAVLWIPFAFCCACIWTAIAGGWSFFDKPYKQGLHDKAAKTVVVSTG
ncbi:RDD family protein [Streptomyces caniscabiei]|uniref:RDD family protein n=1 Tax=Streptomyces caniscabiei TaxID=2746961 RepID=UPI0029B63A5E|nr:RDD family protein [Streptomyces caniscabiei]MDX2606431.1 RDD family protein [Streptomyces caniscabiei]MDX2740133.1 RDD family protein [Streptomyces caniscabiei]MDX2779002.1 RDD family protein [Streptomyces caniscabiei]